MFTYDVYKDAKEAKTLPKEFEKMSSISVLKLKKGSVVVEDMTDISQLKKHIDNASILAAFEGKTVTINAMKHNVSNPAISYKNANGAVVTWTNANSAKNFIQSTYKRKMNGQLKDEKKAFLMFDFNEKLTADNITEAAVELHGFLAQEKVQFFVVRNGKKVVELRNDELPVIINRIKKVLLLK